MKHLAVLFSCCCSFFLVIAPLAHSQQSFVPSLPIKHFPPSPQGSGPFAEREQRERGNPNSQPLVQKSHYAPIVIKQPDQARLLQQAQQQGPPQPPQQQQQSSSNHQPQAQQLLPSQTRPLQNLPRNPYAENYIGGGGGGGPPGPGPYAKVNVKSGGHLANKPRQQQPQQQHRPHLQPQHPPPRKELTSSEELELYEEEEQKPDRLTLLLPNSKFQCSGKKDGYYADDTLNCEVFHYCQDGGKHSWLCPNQFAFHQVHLICVPPSAENICKQSSQFHFVNEYLYRPINEKEAQATNSTLIYADRYYPDGYSVGVDMLPYQEDDQSGNQSGNNYKRPVQHSSHPQHQQQQQQHQPNRVLHNNKNVFFSPESINIPLSERRPVVNSPRPKYDYDEY